MEDSEMKEDIINLGKVLVEELGLEPIVDTLSKWMAHYVSEQIIKAETAKGEEKAKLEEVCFYTILKLWAHHSALPRGKRPFEQFEPIFSTLEKLNPEQSRPFYGPYFPTLSVGLPIADETLESNHDDVHCWLKKTLEVDRAMRIMISFALQQASKDAIDEQTKSLLKHAAGLTSNKEIIVIRQLLGQDEEQVNIDHQKNVLMEKIDQMKTISEFSNQLCDIFTEDLDKLLE